jgi:hypothetical protein
MTSSKNRFGHAQQERHHRFFESSSGEDWQPRAENLIRALRKLKDRHVGFKLRTGGVTADAFPSTEQVAWAIASVRDAGVPLKCTAGLHHPVRHYNESVQTKMHGFLNVFGAGVLAEAKDLSQAQIQSILEDENPEHFTFDENGFALEGFARSHFRARHKPPVRHLLRQLQFRRTTRRPAEVWISVGATRQGLTLRQSMKKGSPCAEHFTKIWAGRPYGRIELRRKS